MSNSKGAALATRTARQCCITAAAASQCPAQNFTNFDSSRPAANSAASAAMLCTSSSTSANSWAAPAPDAAARMHPQRYVSEPCCFCCCANTHTCDTTSTHAAAGRYMPAAQHAAANSALPAHKMWLTSSVLQLQSNNDFDALLHAQQHTRPHVSAAAATPLRAGAAQQVLLVCWPAAAARAAAVWAQRRSAA